MVNRNYTKNKNMELSQYHAITGRRQTYREHPEKGTSPVSCTSYKYNRNEPLGNLLKFLSVALRGGAGINVILDDFVAKEPQNKTFYFYLPEDHPDYKDLSEEQKKRWLPKQQAVKDCFVIYVNDSMEETEDVYVSIQESWDWFIKQLDINGKVAIDLSKLRPKGTINKVGLEASGAVSFLSIYEAILNHINKGDILSLMQLCGQINEVLRRGGSYKNGIVTVSLDYNHPDVVKYLNIELKDLPGSMKKKLRIDEGLLDNSRLLNLVVTRVNDKSLMLEKRIFQVRNKKDNRIEYIIGKSLNYILTNLSELYEIIEELFTQVCAEIIKKPQATCLLSHTNLGQVHDFSLLPEIYKYIMTDLVGEWKTWKIEVGKQAELFLSAEEDKQVGLGVIGLANLLAYHGITFKQHVLALEALLRDNFYPQNTKEYQLAKYLFLAYQDAADIAREAGIERAFTMAPTQSCAYRYLDLNGNTVCKNINPPLSKRVRRTSHTVQNLAGWYFHGDVETMQEVVETHGVDFIQRLWEVWQELMNSTGLAHSQSFDLYRLIDKDWLKDFILYSPLVTTYYQLHDKINQDYLNKGVAKAATSEVTGFCSIDNVDGTCQSCAE